MQETGVGLEQTPAPLHVLAGIREKPSAHAAAPQTTGVPIEQTPAPLQVPAGMRESKSEEQLAAQGTGVGIEQTPALQVLAATTDPPEQVAAGHATGAEGVQVPVPLHIPVSTLCVLSGQVGVSAHISPA